METISMARKAIRARKAAGRKRFFLKIIVDNTIIVEMVESKREKILNSIQVDLPFLG